MGKKPAEIDEIAAVEIYNYVLGQPDLNKKFMFFAMNYNKKVKKGIFDEKLAAKGLLNVVNAAWEKYRAEFYSKGSKDVLDVPTRKRVAKLLLDEYTRKWKGKALPGSKKSSKTNRNKSMLPVLTTKQIKQEIKDLNELLDEIREMIWESKLSFEAKQEYMTDKDFSIDNIKKNIDEHDFDGALDKIGGIKASLDLGSGFDKKIDDFKRKLADLTWELGRKRKASRKKKANKAGKTNESNDSENSSYTFGDKLDAIRQIEDGMGSEGNTEIAELMYDILWKENKIEYYGGLLRPVIKNDEEFNDLWQRAYELHKKKGKKSKKSNKVEEEDPPELQIETGAYVINDEGVFQYGKFLGKFPSDDAAFRFIRQRMDKDGFWPNVFYQGERGDVDYAPGWKEFWEKWEKKKAGGAHEMELYLDANATGDNSAWIGEVLKNGDVRFTIIQEIYGKYQVADISVDKNVATDLNDDNVEQVINQLSGMNNKKWLALDPERRAYLLASSNPFGPEQYMDNDPREYKSLKTALREEGLLDYQDELAF